jgi:hypothetical protein
MGVDNQFFKEFFQNPTLDCAERAVWKLALGNESVFIIPNLRNSQKQMESTMTETNSVFWMQANSAKNSTALSSTVVSVRVVMDSNLAQSIEKPTRTQELSHKRTQGPIWRYSEWKISNRDITGKGLRLACCCWKHKHKIKIIEKNRKNMYV